MRKSLLDDRVVRSRSLTVMLDSTESVSLPSDWDLEDLLADWRNVFDPDEGFQDRLELSDHTVESVREQFERAPDDQLDSTPSSFETAEAVVDQAVEYDSEEVRPLVERHEESPFVHLLAPLVVAIGERVSLETDHTSTTRESLDDWLLDRLTKGFRHPLFILFKAHQKTEYPDTDFGSASDSGGTTDSDSPTNSTAVYDEFVRNQLDTDYERIFEQYPLLTSFLGEVAEQWCQAVRQLDGPPKTSHLSQGNEFPTNTRQKETIVARERRNP